MKIKIWRKADYPTIEEAEKDGAVYTSVFLDPAEAPAFKQGALLAAKCINENQSDLGFEEVP